MLLQIRQIIQTTLHVIGLLALATVGDISKAAEVGGCKFSSETLSFQGSALEQSKCLLTPVLPKGRIGSPLQSLPLGLENLIGKTVELRTDVVSHYLRSRQIAPDEVGGDLSMPLSVTSKNNPALYFVIHDTSSPTFGAKEFPDNLNTMKHVNNLSKFVKTGAHIFVNRIGESRTTNKFSTASRATKLENQVVGKKSRGRFIHMELVQPRRRHSAHKKYESVAPTPGFTNAQYERAALIYIVASVRGGIWLVPAYHRLVDDKLDLIKAGRKVYAHDDPQSFDLDKFAYHIENILNEMYR